MEARFHNPYDTARGSWSYGFIFRGYEQNRFYIVVVTSDKYWHIDARLSGDGDDDQELGEGYFPHIKTGRTESNLIRVEAKGDTGTLHVNGRQVAELDLSTISRAGEISAVANYFREDGIPGEHTNTRFENLTVSVPAAPAAPQQTAVPVPTATPRPTTPATGTARIEHWGNWYRDVDVEEFQEQAMENYAGVDVELKMVTLAPVPYSPDQEVYLHLVCAEQKPYPAVRAAWIESATDLSLEWVEGYFIAPWDTNWEDGSGDIFIEEHTVENYYADLTEDKSMVFISNPIELARIIAAMRHTNTDDALLLDTTIGDAEFKESRVSDFDPDGLGIL